MNSFVSCLKFGLLVVLFSGLVVSQTHAASASHCRDYAKKAVEMQKKNLSYRCGYKGPAWTLDYAGHYRWCMQPGKGLRNSTMKASLVRGIAIKRCEKKVFCRVYGRRAVAAQKVNLARRCGYKGSAWNANFYFYHYKWCMKVSNAEANKATRYRQKALARCKPKFSKTGYCKSYARVAVAKQKVNLKRRCGYKGPRWNARFLHHYKWCLRVTLRASKMEATRRHAAILRCLRKKR